MSTIAGPGIMSGMGQMVEPKPAPSVGSSADPVGLTRQIVKEKIVPVDMLLADLGEKGQASLAKMLTQDKAYQAEMAKMALEASRGKTRQANKASQTALKIKGKYIRRAHAEELLGIRHEAKEEAKVARAHKRQTKKPVKLPSARALKKDPAAQQRVLETAKAEGIDLDAVSAMEAVGSLGDIGKGHAMMKGAKAIAGKGVKKTAKVALKTSLGIVGIGVGGAAAYGAGVGLGAATGMGGVAGLAGLGAVGTTAVTAAAGGAALLTGAVGVVAVGLATAFVASKAIKGLKKAGAFLENAGHSAVEDEKAQLAMRQQKLGMVR